MSKNDYVYLPGDYVFQTVFTVIGIPFIPGENATTEDNEPLEIYRDQVFELTELQTLTCAVLKDICKAKSLIRSGNKAQLVQRILQSAVDVIPVEKPIQEVLMGCWFMTPVKSVEMKLGSLNERNIVKAFPSFLEKHSGGTTLIKLKEYGLLSLKNHPEAAFLPDGIGCFACDGRGEFIAGCEWKTMTIKTRSEANEQLLVHTHGRYSTINLIEDPAHFKDLIPSKNYRGQLIHNLCCAGIDDWFYVTASLYEILRVVHCQVNEQFRHDYVACMTLCKERYMSFIYNDGPLPENCVVGHCKDRQTFVATLKLWRAMNKLVEERGRPLPRGKHILPSLVALWNRIKGGVDVYSRMLKNCKSVHHCLAPGAAIWLRMLMTMVYNGHQSYLMLQSYTYLMEDVECKTFQKYMFHKNTHKTFADYCRDGIYGIGGITIDGVTVQGMGTAAHALSTDSSGEGHVSKRIRYNIRAAYFNENSLVKKRTGMRVVHTPSRINTLSHVQKTCVWCCQKKHGPDAPRHSRFGYKTTMCCAICDNVPLCIVKRVNEKSCFELWHTATELYNACACDVNSPITRSHRNRSAPPSRRRVEIDEPNNRSTAAVVTIQQSRQTDREATTPTNLFPTEEESADDNSSA